METKCVIYEYMACEPIKSISKFDSSLVVQQHDLESSIIHLPMYVTQLTWKHFNNTTRPVDKNHWGKTINVAVSMFGPGVDRSSIG